MCARSSGFDPVTLDDSVTANLHCQLDWILSPVEDCEGVSRELYVRRGTPPRV